MKKLLWLIAQWLSFPQNFEVILMVALFLKMELVLHLEGTEEIKTHREIIMSKISFLVRTV
jgi:hypothetical protein